MAKFDRIMMKGVWIAMAIIGVYLVANCFWTGQIKFTGAFVDRSYDPYYYWAETILIAFGLVIMPLWLFYRERRKR